VAPALNDHDTGVLSLIALGPAIRPCAVVVLSGDVTHPVEGPTSRRRQRISVGADAQADAVTGDFAVPGAYEVRTDDPGAANVPALYWSVRGEVACEMHVAGPGSQRWSEERWAEIPSEVRGRHGIRYQCQHCADPKTPIVHRRLNADTHE
jgi:hypothetical protein